VTRAGQNACDSIARSARLVMFFSRAELVFLLVILMSQLEPARGQLTSSSAEGVRLANGPRAIKPITQRAPLLPNPTLPRTSDPARPNSWSSSCVFLSYKCFLCSWFSSCRGNLLCYYSITRFKLPSFYYPFLAEIFFWLLHKFLRLDSCQRTCSTLRLLLISCL
jgi:hypothetical protein